MSEYLGYIGTLHQIDSETSTVALENVRSYGTEGRCENPADELPPVENLYEYIVFKGSDVKDLTILGSAADNQSPVQSDLAIVDFNPAPIENWLLTLDNSVQAGPRPPQMQTQQMQTNPEESLRALLEQQQQQQQQGQAQGSQQPFMPMPFPQFPPYSGHPQGMGPPPYPGQQRFDPQGMRLPPHADGGFPNMPFGPPGWMYPNPGQGFPNQNRPFPNQNMPFMPMGQPQQPIQSPQPTPIGQGPNKEPNPSASAQQSRSGSIISRTTSIGPTPPKSTTPAGNAPIPPVESKPKPAAALAPPAPVATQAGPTSKPGNVPTTRPFGQIVPAIPAMANINLRGPSPMSGPGGSSGTTINLFQQNRSQPSQAAANAALQDATQAATAAMAAAMAKLSPATGSKQLQQQQQTTNGNAVETMTRKMNEMKTGGGGADRQPPRHEGQGTGGYRGGRGRGAHQPTRKIEVPTTDYDFETANAKFNKQDLVKEAIASGSPLSSPNEHHQPATNGTGQTLSSIVNNNNNTSSDPAAAGAAEKTSIPVSTYNKASSFFDNISSDAKEHDSGNPNRPGGREWRGEEQKRNLETFGQGSVDTGYHHHHRGGYRGRGRGRGGYGGGNYRGGRGGNRTGGGGNRINNNQNTGGGGNGGTGTAGGGGHQPQQTHRSGNPTTESRTGGGGGGGAGERQLQTTATTARAWQ
ncbi:MAG: hypothetical protein M1816_001043 [Peltula sp. TS41687]|nr:MAG: hypothetical protein M1816_001043 [Peltula sp. TS41687]